ncbi:MAG TPA: lysophospholipid acyltransferase family protein, partial [Candidatus Dormibacteraeota bacterium]|nr:lysophospholipid acyltransferase family protein [Candidatus Dormibacteraeota bacterium]
PERLAAERGGALEGLAWLGRTPEVRASRLVRILAVLARGLLFGVLRFRIERSGRELLPPGGYLLVGAVHRGWIDPFLILDSLPLEPWVWFLGSGPSAFDRRWKEWLLHRVGGMLPVWRGGVGVDQHVASARAVVEAGGVFVLLPEGGVAGPPDRLAPFRTGGALIALRTGARIVPFVMVGGEELYLGKRFATRILAPTTAAELLGPAWDGLTSEPGTRTELDLAERLTMRFADLLGPEVVELYPRTVDAPGRPRRLRGLTRLLLPRRRR